MGRSKGRRDNWSPWMPALGAGFSLILVVNAVLEFLPKKVAGEIFAFLAVVGLVLVGVVRFFHLLMEQVRELLGLQEEYVRAQFTAEAKRHVTVGLVWGSLC